MVREEIAAVLALQEEAVGNMVASPASG